MIHELKVKNLVIEGTVKLMNLLKIMPTKSHMSLLKFSQPSL